MTFFTFAYIKRFIFDKELHLQIYITRTWRERKEHWGKKIVKINMTKYIINLAPAGRDISGVNQSALGRGFLWCYTEPQLAD